MKKYLLLAIFTVAAVNFADWKADVDFKADHPVETSYTKKEAQEASALIDRSTHMAKIHDGQTEGIIFRQDPARKS